MYISIAAIDVISFITILKNLLQHKLISMKDVCKIKWWITQRFEVEFVKQFPNDKLEDVLTRAERIIQGATVQLIMAPTVSLFFYYCA